MRCLRSVLDQQMPVRITVVDNASSDGSIETLRHAMNLQENIEIIETGENPGFARGVNTAARALPIGREVPADP